MKTKTCAWILLIQVLTLLGLTAFLFPGKEQERRIGTDISDWQCRYAEYEDGWYIDSDFVSGKTVDFIYGPYVELPRGSYTVKISYRCDSDQSFLPYASKGKSAFLKAETAKLSKNKNQVSYDFVATEDIDNFEVVVKYNGSGALEVWDIEIIKNTENLRRLLVVLLAVFFGADCWIFWLKQDAAARNSAGKILLMGLFVSLPLFVSGINIGHDLRFHLMRIEGIAEELKNGVFPVRMSSLWMDGYGYPVSIYYGDFLLYVPAFLRIAGFSVEVCYKLYLLLINLGTAAIAWFCFKNIFQDEKIAFAVAFVYVTASYRLVDVYIRAAVGEYSAMMFLPLAALAFYRICTEKNARKERIWQNALLFSVGMSGVICTHILTAEMVILLLVPLCMVLWKRVKEKSAAKTLVLAALETLGLSLYFLTPFLDYYKNVDVKINETVAGETVKKIQSGGTYIAQYFAFFQNPFGINSTEVDERMLLTPGVVLMAALVVGALLWFYKKGNREIYFLTGLSAAVLFLASDLFPWDHLAYHSALGNLMAQVQFPWRYIGIAAVILALLAGSILKQVKDKRLPGICIAVCAVMTLFFLSSYVESAYIGKFRETAELDDYKVVNGEYLRQETDSSRLSHLRSWLLWENLEQAQIEERSGCYLKLSCIGGVSEGYVELPLFSYKGYQAVDENGREMELSDGENGVLRLTVPAGYEGTVEVDFVSPWYWRLSELISLLTAAGLAVGMFWKRRAGFNPASSGHC